MQYVKKFRDFFIFWTRSTLYSKIFNILFPKVFIATLIDVLCSNFVKFGRREIGKIACCLLDKKQNFAWYSRSRYCADRAKNLPGPLPTICSKCSRFDPNWFTFG